MIIALLAAEHLVRVHHPELLEWLAIVGACFGVVAFVGVLGLSFLRDRDIAELRARLKKLEG